MGGQLIKVVRTLKIEDLGFEIRMLKKGKYDVDEKYN